MRWLWLVAAAICFAIPFVTHSVGLGALALVAALAFLIIGTLALASSRIESRGRHESTMLGPEEMRAIREQAERRKRETAAGGSAAATFAAGGTPARRHDAEIDVDSVSGSGGDGSD
jgi:hypothetical protein